MAHTTVTLSMEAYDALKRERWEGESFSEEILRTFKRPSITEAFGILGKKGGDALEKSVRKLRKEFRVREWRS